MQGSYRHALLKHPSIEWVAGQNKTIQEGRKGLPGGAKAPAPIPEHFKIIMPFQIGVGRSIISREQGACLEGAGPEGAGEAGELAGEGQQVEVHGQRQCQPRVALRVLHQLHQLRRRLVLACTRTADRLSGNAPAGLLCLKFAVAPPLSQVSNILTCSLTSSLSRKSINFKTSGRITMSPQTGM